MDIEWLKNIIAETSPNINLDSITEDTSFADMGLDSLDLAQVIFSVENELDIVIDPDILEEIVTVSDALEAIQEAQH